MNWDDIPGNSQSIDAIYSRAVAEAKDGDVFVELGVYYGRSLAMLAEMVERSGKDIRIFGIDLWEEAGVVTRNASHPYEPAREDTCRRNLLACASPLPRVGDPTLICRDTADAAESWDGGSVTLAFIDGDHSYEGCRRDIAAWWPKVKPGGLLAGHDYSHEYPGVIQAVTEAFPDYVHHGGPWGDTGICFYWRKPL